MASRRRRAPMYVSSMRVAIALVLAPLVAHAQPKPREPAKLAPKTAPAKIRRSTPLEYEITCTRVHRHFLSALNRRFVSAELPSVGRFRRLIVEP